jgi:hypothetical protein
MQTAEQTELQDLALRIAASRTPVAPGDYELDGLLPEFVDQYPGESLIQYLERVGYEDDGDDDNDQAELANSFEGHAGRPGRVGGSLPKGESELPEPQLARFNSGDVCYSPYGERGTISVNPDGVTIFSTDDGRINTRTGLQFLESKSEHDHRVACDKAVASEFLSGEQIDNYSERLKIDFDSTTAGKKFACGNLAKDTGFEPGLVRGAIHNWAESSNDTLYGSLINQQLSTAIGAAPSDWQNQRFAEVSKMRETKLLDQTISDSHLSPFEYIDSKVGEPDPATGAFAVDAKIVPRSGIESVEQAHTKLLKAMYARTQEHLERHGIKYVTLYRGVAVPEGAVEKADRGDKVDLKANALESWSTNKKDAYNFADGERGHNGMRAIVLKATVPASSIVSHAATGFGCLDEHEFVVHNGRKFPTIIEAKLLA